MAGTTVSTRFVGGGSLDIVDAPEVELDLKHHLGADSKAEQLDVTVSSSVFGGRIFPVKPVFDADDDNARLVDHLERPAHVGKVVKDQAPPHNVGDTPEHVFVRHARLLKPPLLSQHYVEA